MPRVMTPDLVFGVLGTLIQQDAVALEQIEAAVESVLRSADAAHSRLRGPLYLEAGSPRMMDLLELLKRLREKQVLNLLFASGDHVDPSETANTSTDRAETSHEPTFE